MLTRISKQSITALLILSFVIPSGLFLYPQKAVAQQKTSCLQVVAGAMAAALGINALLTKLGVTSGSSDGATNAVTGGASYGTFFNDCVLKPLAMQMAKTLLHNMTVQTVNWINNGFKGNPGFAVDLGSMMQDTADQVIGSFIAKEAAFLCSPFSFQIKIALAKSQLPFERRSSCTLTQVINNVNGFINNNGRVGWDNWIQITTKPQNNAYGAFQIYQDEMLTKIEEKIGIDQSYLSWGRGFKDWEFCETQAEATARFKQQNGNLGADQAVPECRKETPGAVVEQRLTATLNMDLQQIGLANDINAVYDALTNQLVKSIMEKGAGILGGSRGPRKSRIPMYDYLVAAQNNTINNNTPLGNALNNTISQGIKNAQLQVAAPVYDVVQGGGIQTGVITIGLPVPPQTLSLQVTPGSITVDSQNGLNYQGVMSTNYPTGGLNYRVAFKNDGFVDIPFLNVFDEITIEYTLSDGRTLYSKVTDGVQATVNWADVTTDTGKPLSIKLTGSKRAGAIGGTYYIQTVIYDQNANELSKHDQMITVIPDQVRVP